MLLSPNDSFESAMEDNVLRELEGNRPRSRTWPLPQPEDFEGDKAQEEKTTAKLEQGSKKGSRKNAWGNQSYADLITQAIQSSAEQRMTLAQIYSWMVENVGYFKDKGDNTSSAGWKNSIRHNLSLHSRFIRIQNEGNGKSSWWTVDPDAKSEKTKRRSRSSSLDSDNAPKATKAKRPGRKSSKRDHIGDDKPQSPNSKRIGCIAPKSPINGEPSVILEDNPFPFPLADYRHRSSSNASNVSSISGRLSPIPSHDEDLDTDEMSLSPAHELEQPVVVDELLDNMKENLSMTMSRPQQKSPVEIAAQFRSRCNNEDSMNIDSPPAQFVDNRYPTNEYYPAPSLKQAPLSAAKIPQQKGFFTENTPNTLQQHINSIYHRGNASSPSHFTPERVYIRRENNRPPPPYNAVHLNNSLVQRPKIQQIQSRLPVQGNNNFLPHFQTAPNDNVPIISVEMADELPVDIDVDFLEGDIKCDVETVIRNDLAFNDNYLDFNLDNYVSAIALPEISLPNHVSGNMVH